MADFQTVRKRGNKYPEQHRVLSEMGFDSAAINSALDKTSGDLDAATAVLLGEPVPQNASATPAAAQDSLAPMKVVGKGQSPHKTAPKVDIKELHNKFMTTYKVAKCKEKPNHDKRSCMYHHSASDRRRNPFEYRYTCTECPSAVDGVCPEGDACTKAHNMLERMFHPDLYKISYCTSAQNGVVCERGTFCAFAHMEEDHRVPFAFSASKTTSPTKPGAVPGSPDSNSDVMHAGKVLSAGDSKVLDEIQDKLIKLIKQYGPDGIISSELPKRFLDAYDERLELADEAGERFRIKDLLLAHPYITFSMHKGVQPRYVYDENKPLTSTNASPAKPVTSATTTPLKSSVKSSTDVTAKPAGTTWASVASPGGAAKEAASSAVADTADTPTSRSRRRGPADLSLEVPVDSSNANASTPGKPFAAGVMSVGTPSSLFGGNRGESSPIAGGGAVGLFATAADSVFVDPKASSTNGSLGSMSPLAASLGIAGNRSASPGFGALGLGLSLGDAILGSGRRRGPDHDGGLAGLGLGFSSGAPGTSSPARFPAGLGSVSGGLFSQGTSDAELSQLRAELTAAQVLVKQREEEITALRETLKAKEESLRKSEELVHSLSPELSELRKRLGLSEDDKAKSNARNMELDHAHSALLGEVAVLRQEAQHRAHSNGNTEVLFDQLQQAQGALNRSARDREELIEHVVQLTMQMRGDASPESADALREHLHRRFQNNMPAGPPGMQGIMGSPMSPRVPGGPGPGFPAPGLSPHGMSLPFPPMGGPMPRGMIRSFGGSPGPGHVPMQQRGMGIPGMPPQGPPFQAGGVPPFYGDNGVGARSDGTDGNGGDDVCALPGCNRKGRFICGGCSARYCGPDHQSEHWASHRLECGMRK